tara:strand:+ start:445 stop:1689 length:1245 start_codon:yes stop_codon:yes gene_type:complete
MTKIKTLEEIKYLLVSDFGIKNISGRPILTTNSEDISGILGSALPSIYYRAEIEYENYKNNAYVIFSLALDPVKNTELYSYNENTIRILNYSQNPGRSSSSPEFKIELRENNIDQSFEVAYRQFHKNLENDEFENIFLDKDLKTLKLAFSEMETILNKTKKERNNLVQQVNVENELKTFSLDPQMFNDFNILDLQKTCTLFLEARYGALHKLKEDNSDIQTLEVIDWQQLYNTYTTKNIALSYLNKINDAESFKINDEFLISIYFTIIKDLNDIEQKIFTKALKNLNIETSILENNLYKAIDRMKKFQNEEYQKRQKLKSSIGEAPRKREYKIEINSVTNPKLNKTRDALLYIEVLLRLISKNNTMNQDLLLQRSLDMYLRTKFARFKQDGYINNSKNGPRYTLESKGRNLLTK